jgi:hypothetical protein
MKSRWARLGRPVKIGLIVGLVGALMTVIGLFTTDFAPLTARSLLLGIVIGGGSWGVISWAIASAAADAMADAAGDARADAGSDSEE